MKNLELLNTRFGLGNELVFRRDTEGMVLADVANPLATARICLQGGHVMTWQPRAAAEPVIWLSPQARPAPGKSLRGGVPICWPWFGPHASRADFPGHGYARTVGWGVTETRRLDDGATLIMLELVENERTRAMWPWRCELSVTLTVGSTLKVELTTTNLDSEEFVIGEALHTYLQIGDIDQVRVLGLEDCAYLDKVAGGTRARQQGALTFAGECDRVYVDSEADCVIEDRSLGRRLRVAKSGSRSTVVWSPGAAKAEKMGDFGPDGWRAMLCVESANALENVVTVRPQGSHTLAAEYSLEPL